MAETKTTESATPEIIINKIATETINIPIVGTSPLIVHRFSEKAKRQMLDAMQGRKSPKQPKDPDAEYKSSLYYLKSGEPAFPVVAFKAATISAARFYGKQVTMTSLRQFLFMKGEAGDDGQQMVRIHGDHVMREDVVRVGQGTDLRYRAQFTEWSATLTVVYVASALTRDSVLSLVDAGGMGVGVGEWRPEKKGDFGTYSIDPTREVEVLS